MQKTEYSQSTPSSIHPSIHPSIIIPTILHLTKPQPPNNLVEIVEVLLINNVGSIHKHNIIKTQLRPLHPHKNRRIHPCIIPPRRLSREREINLRPTTRRIRDPHRGVDVRLGVARVQNVKRNVHVDSPWISPGHDDGIVGVHLDCVGSFTQVDGMHPCRDVEILTPRQA